MKIPKAFRPKGFFGFPLLLALWMPPTLSGEDKMVTVGPDNRNPTIKFFSEQEGSTHTLQVSVASGWKFVQGPVLAVNPFTLWTKTGNNTFAMASLGDLHDGAGTTENQATVIGKIRRIGGGGGGGQSSDIDVSVTMLTRYFSMVFYEPFNDREYVHEEEEDIPVSVLLANATGKPASATVNFAFENNVANLQDTTVYNNGVASNLFAVTGSAGETFDITALAQDVDITEGRMASGINTSEQSLTIFKVESVTVHADDSNSYYLEEKNDIDQVGTVKGSGSIVLKANIVPETSDLKSLVDWEGAVEDGTDPFKATLSRSTVSEKVIRVMVDGTARRDARVWIVWTEFTSFNNTGPTPSDSSVSPPAYGASSGTRNGMLLQATILPPGFNDVGNVSYDIKRTKERATWWKNGSTWEQLTHVGPGAGDDSGNDDEDLSPSATSHIYVMDFPGFIYSTAVADELVYKASFIEFVNIKLGSSPWIKVSEDFSWHSITWLEDNGSGQWQRKTSESNEIAPGSITVGTSSTP